jgi:hypothetical protein
MIDYRELLKSYMQVIYAHESISFVDHIRFPRTSEVPNIDESLILELEKIDSEVRKKLDYD